MAFSTEHTGLTDLDYREVIQRVSDHACRENSGGTFVTWNAANHAAIVARTFAETVIITSTRSRYTPAAFPAVAAGWYRVLIWDAGANDVIATTPDFYWDGGNIAQNAGAVRSNTAQAGAAGTITLDASASSVTNFYAGGFVQVVSGTGVGQSRLITAYNGSTKVATIAPNWATNPDNTSVFAIFVTPGFAALTAQLDDIEAKTALISSDGFTVSSPVDPATGTLRLIAGDGYETAERKIQWTKADYAGPTISGTGKLRITTIDRYQKQSPTTAVLEADATVTMDGDNMVVTVLLSEAQTATLQPGPTAPGAVTHWYQVIIDTEEGETEDDATNFMGNCIVRRRIAPIA